MKGMTLDKYGNLTFDKSSAELTSEELEQQLKSIYLGPVNETITVVGNKDGLEL
ncbi:MULTISPECIES: hypothetical protein [Legionella]|uniref:hypothetical protein n=1 Tax=Legionella TaxID=445 RepID=UPI001AC86B37|nr:MULTISPECIES: hypothetical protein [Legionella]MBN9227828.1 hypothetical protein [Legionella steelei]